MLRTTAMLLILGATIATAEEAEHKNKEEKLARTDVPAAVLATMQTAAAGAALKEFEKETEAGKTVFTAEFVDAAGKEQEVTVAADGKLVSVAPEDDGDEEKGGKGEEGGEHEHGDHDRNGQHED